MRFFLFSIVSFFSLSNLLILEVSKLNISKNLDGRPLPPDYYKRHGEIGKIDRPGGILVNDAVINAPI